MNYLAHLLLADHTDASRIGNLLGDFAKGSLAELRKTYPNDLVLGIEMHRAVDKFTDSHPTFKKSRSLLAPERSRFAGIIIDILYDHFLAKHWAKYAETPLDIFTQEVYQALERHPEWHAGRLAEILPSLKNDDWLMNYRSIEGIAYTLQRVSMRSPGISPIAGGIHDLKKHYSELETIFHEFMPELIYFSDQWKQTK